MKTTTKNHLAWHETMEMHELISYQTTHLIGFKMDVHHVQNPQLRALYNEAIQSLEQNLQELLGYYPKAPVVHRSNQIIAEDMTAYYASCLLGFAKTAVRNYAIAITETSTSQLRDTLHKQLDHAIRLHAKTFYFMLENGLYPSYDLDKMLANDVKNAQKAISM